MGVKWANQGFKVSGLIFPSQYEFDCLNHIDETFRELILIGRDTCTKVDPLDILTKKCNMMKVFVCYSVLNQKIV